MRVENMANKDTQEPMETTKSTGGATTERKDKPRQDSPVKDESGPWSWMDPSNYESEEAYGPGPMDHAGFMGPMGGRGGFMGGRGGFMGGRGGFMGPMGGRGGFMGGRGGFMGGRGGFMEGHGGFMGGRGGFMGGRGGYFNPMGRGGMAGFDDYGGKHNKKMAKMYKKMMKKSHKWHMMGDDWQQGMMGHDMAGMYGDGHPGMPYGPPHHVMGPHWMAGGPWAEDPRMSGMHAHFHHPPGPPPPPPPPPPPHFGAYPGYEEGSSSSSSSSSDEEDTAEDAAESKGDVAMEDGGKPGMKEESGKEKEKRKGSDTEEMIGEEMMAWCPPFMQPQVRKFMCRQRKMNRRREKHGHKHKHGKHGCHKHGWARHGGPRGMWRGGPFGFVPHFQPERPPYWMVKHMRCMAKRRLQKMSNRMEMIKSRMQAVKRWEASMEKMEKEYKEKEEKLKKEKKQKTETSETQKSDGAAAAEGGDAKESEDSAPWNNWQQWQLYLQQMYAAEGESGSQSSSDEDPTKKMEEYYWAQCFPGNEEEPWGYFGGRGRGWGRGRGGHGGRGGRGGRVDFAEPESILISDDPETTKDKSSSGDKK